MKENSGFILVVLGALMLIASYAFNLEDYNWYNILALLVIIAGIVTHIVVSKKS